MFEAIMVKSQSGIETGQYQTSGVNDDVKEGESKPRGGQDSAVARPRTALQDHDFAHCRPVTS